MKVVLGMPFLAFSNADFQFGAERLTWRSYTAAEALPTARQVELIDNTSLLRRSWMKILKRLSCRSPPWKPGSQQYTLPWPLC